MTSTMKLRVNQITVLKQNVLHINFARFRTGRVLPCTRVLYALPSNDIFLYSCFLNV